MNNSPLIIALDYPDRASALKMAGLLDPARCRVKVGKELFTRCGPDILDQLHKLGFQVFLDLKYHDIPATTAKACAVAASAGVWMLNVHASGGRKMMETAVEALSRFEKRPLLIGVTVLTSMSEAELMETGITGGLRKHVSRLAALAHGAGLDGVVCSAQETEMIREETSKHFCLVTPGIRPSFANQDDQTRIVTPVQAIKNGSDYLVIGRPITKADEPMKALDRVLQELKI